MMDLTPEAKRRFDDYLQRIHTALRGTRAIESGEVEQNVREHVEFALAGAPAPVGAEHLAEVLEQLGPPERWLPEEERPLWRRVGDRILRGPEDWRLAYLTFAVFFLMFVLFMVGGVLLLIPAFLLARAHVELVKERGQDLGARRWLVLPPIACVLVLVAAGALVLPIAVSAAISGDRDTLTFFGFEPQDHNDRVRIHIGLATAGAGIGWMILSAIFAAVLPQMQKLFAPFLASLRRTHALNLTIAGAALIGIGLVILYAF
jgi:hypothetical protein